ncbi:MAG: hypothetical protein OXG05_13860 [Gammaproteobacteria bacterium]|nr:hypothetical protein [Gammaproteobacteria bacterium]
MKLTTRRFDPVEKPPTALACVSMAGKPRVYYYAILVVCFGSLGYSAVQTLFSARYSVFLFVFGMIVLVASGLGSISELFDAKSYEHTPVAQLMRCAWLVFAVFCLAVPFIA